MGVPASHEVELAGEHRADLTMLCFLVRPIRIAGPMIRPPWPGNGADFNQREREACEEKPASLPLPESRLSMAVEVGEYIFAESMGLPGDSDIEVDHAARFLVWRPHFRSMIVAPSSAWGAIARISSLQSNS